MSEYKPGEIEPKWQAALARGQAAQNRNSTRKTEILCSRHVSLSFRVRAACGALRGIYGDRYHCPVEKHAGIQCSASDGVGRFWPAGRKLRHKTGVHPRITTEQAIANFRRQIDSVGFCYDWDREVNTTIPEYYKWTQWIFLQLFKMGLAYEGVMPINWCPSCKTGLANEEVKGGHANAAARQVERKALRQWLLRITRYADRLLEDLKDVDWPESTLLMQKNWIGRSEGAEVTFHVSGRRLRRPRNSVCLPPGPIRSMAPPIWFFRRNIELVEPSQRPNKEARCWLIRSRRGGKAILSVPTLPRRRPASLPEAYAINPVNGRKSRSGSPTMCLPPTARAPSWRFRRMTSATLRLRQNSICPIIEVVQSGRRETTLPYAAFIEEGISGQFRRS